MTTGTLRPPVGPGGHRLGADAGHARVEITAFGDYECPYSRRLDQLIREELIADVEQALRAHDQGSPQPPDG